jgi:hypothetical protein
MMAHEPAQRGRFADLVRIHLDGRRFLDRDQELRLLEEGVTRYGISLDEARATLRTATEQDEVPTERETAAAAGELRKSMADRRGRVARHDFAKVVGFYRARSGGGLTPAEAEKRVKRLMMQAELAPRASGGLLPSRRWYRAIPE